MSDDHAVLALINDAWLNHDEPLTVYDLTNIVATVRRAVRDEWVMTWQQRGTGFPESTEYWMNGRIAALGVTTVTGDTT